MSSTFRSLRVRNFRLWFYGQALSSCGSWMQLIAQGWLVLELSHNSGAAVGAITAAQAVPTLVLGTWGGIVADRSDKRRVLMITAAAQAIAASVLAVLTLTGAVRIWMVFVLAVLLGTGQAFDSPARYAFTHEMVGTEDLPNAVSLSGLLMQGGRIVGPALAGVVIVFAGTGWCFALNALSFVVLIVALVFIRPGELVRMERVTAGKGQIREGMRYVWHTPMLRNLMFVAAVVGTFSTNNSTVLPLAAKLTFGGDAGTYSLMTTVVASGAFVGALLLAHHGRATMPLLFFAGLFWAGAVCIESAAPSLTSFLFVLGFAGLGMTTFLTTHQSLLQLNVEPAMVGRVMSILMFSLYGMTLFGAPFVGWLSTATSPRIGLAVGGVATLCSAVVFVGPAMLRERVRGGVHSWPVVRRRVALPVDQSAMKPATPSSSGTPRDLTTNDTRW